MLTLSSHPAQRGPPGGPAAPNSRDVQDAPQLRAASLPPHDRLEPPVTSPLTSPVVTMETKKQQSGALQQAPSRRKVGGGGSGQQQLRSPVVKRAPAAPVTLQGWLHKQGSEGLMLWKKRWFVLSEYCLFYYKGPEEEKLLGSILLPSYKISPCSTEDRVYRKFAFKAEHTNMRTYYFATDTRELMVQWMNALSLASILQEGSSWDDHRSGRPSVSSISSLLNQSADDSDSGFHGYRPPHSVTTGTPSTVPASSSSKLSNEQVAKKEDISRQLNTSHDSVFSNGWGMQKQSTGYHQPLYANAPPKPRRLAEHEDHGASSPEPSSERRAEELAGKKTPQDPEGNKSFVPRIAQPQQPVRNERGVTDVQYHYHQTVGQNRVQSSQQSSQQEQLQRLYQPPQVSQQGSGSHAQVVTNVERRTPDTYGRSNSTTPGSTGPSKAVSSKGGDYEDVYNTSDTVRHIGSEGTYGEVYARSSQVAYIKGAGPVMSIHHKQKYSDRGHGDSRPLPQGGGQYGHSGQHQQNFATHSYASVLPSQQPDMHAPNVYSMPLQQQPPPPPPPPPPQYHHQSVQPTRHREAQPNRYPPRPHSADFLDYDAKRHNQHYLCQPQYSGQEAATGSRDHLQCGGGGGDKMYQEQHVSRVARLPRPKSSLEMMPPPDPSVSDNYYWSEELYAQKMRQSASYVHQIPMMHPRNQSSSSRATTPSVRLSTPSGVMTVDGGMKSGAQMGGVSSGGSVNSESAGVILRHPKRMELMPSDAATVRSPSRQQCQQQHQQRRWSEYRDPCSNGQFTRSASARLPRQRYQDDENDSQCEERQKSTSDVREGEKKIQQREESMKRLLEWKQRMLQSPLTRKPSGSSTRGTAQNELSKYYKQQVLRELASQESRNRDLTNNQEGRGSSKRRSQQEDTGTVPGRSALRSRSQDGRRSSTSLSRYNSYSSDDEASGSGSVIGRDPLPPRAVSAMSLQQQVKDTPPPTITLTTEETPQDHSAPNSLARKTSPSSPLSGGMNQPSIPSGPQNAGNVERSDPVEGQGKRNWGGGGGGGSGPWGISVSAGDLLGRTHEELVLLLIQLRRQSAGVCKAMETCHVEIEAQARLAELETPKRLEHLQKLDELKRHLLDLEKQYEKGKPLVNLVDNMVKLGSLYRGSGMPLHPGTGGPSDVHSVRERLEFNQKVQEQRLLAEERRDWDRVSPDRGQLQAKVQELYRLDRLLQEESGTLQSLQQDKELLEKALGGLRHKLQGSRANPAEAERYRKQQRVLEKELSRIRLLLAHNSKKLEETVAENARLEQELVVLRQKLQASQRGTPQHHQRSAVALVPDSASTGTTAALEAELRRVQQLVGDLQRQRQELSIQVRHLTEKSHSLVQQIRPGPTGVAGAGPIPGRKRHHSTWMETDLDSLMTFDHGLDSPASPQHQTSPPGSKIQPAAPSHESISQSPLYVNTDASSKRIADQNIYKGSLVDGEDLIPPPLPAPPELPPDYPPPPPPPPSEEAMMNGGIGQQYCTQMDISEADDRMKRFYGIIPREKQQEIKTVRIVKRESERRQRDRDRSGNIGIPITNGTAGGKRVTIVEDGDIGTSQYPVEKQQLGRVLEEEPQEKQFTEESMTPEEDPVLTQFQRSMSLPRGFGKRERLGYQQQQVVPPLPPVRVPSPRSDSVTVLRNLMINRHRVRFESCSGGSTSSAESTSGQRAVSPSLNPNRPLTAHEQLFGVSHDDPVFHHYAITSPGSSDVSPQLSPVFKSEAARAIVMEMSSMKDAAGYNMEHQPRRRAVPREKRRHHTVSSSQPLLDIETATSPIMGSARSRDDLDMERALRPRLNAPDVVRSTMSHKDFKYNENTIDSILGTPNKIVIPERYIPEQAPELSAEEQLHRLKKAEAIRKMLSETTSITASDTKEKEEEEQSSTLKKKVAAEKKQREHLLQLNQILAKQVMEKSKMVAGSTSVPSQE